MLIPGSSHSLGSKMGWHVPVAGAQSYSCPVWLTATSSRGAPTTSLEEQPQHTQSEKDQEHPGYKELFCHEEVRLWESLGHFLPERQFRSQSCVLSTCV